MFFKLALYCGFLVLLVTTRVHAEDFASIYQIDVIVFEHTDPQRFAAEKWPSSVGTIDHKNAVDLNNLAKGVPDSLDTMQTLDALDQVGEQPVKKIIPATVTLVEPQSRLLNKEALAIKTSKDQKILQYFSWNQPLAWNVNSTPVYFSGQAPDKAEIQGIIRIKPVKGMLQVHLDMLYTTSPSERSNRSGVHEFRIKQDFKLKKKEIFYIDHPLVGALIMVAPVLDEY